jgi:hypothetical protein
LVAFGLVALTVPSLVYVIVLALNWPFSEQSLINILQERSTRSVTVNHFYRTYFPPGCVAEGISFLHRKQKNKTPLITIQRLVIAASYSELLTVQNRLSLVQVFGMHVTVPPKQPDGKPNPIMPLTYSKSPSKLMIDKIIADGAELEFMSSNPEEKRFQLVIDKLALQDIGNNEAIAYQAVLSDTMPAGKIRSTGKFGPWNPEDPGRTPVSGSYTFSDAKLEFFEGISGTLSSSGNFHGILRAMQTEGTVDVPNFKVTSTNHTRQLATRFHAVVDATNGNTDLQDVTAHFDGTTALFKGAMSSKEGEKGKTVLLDIVAPNARIEDLLNLFISARRALMNGEVSMRAHVELPPGSQPFVTKLKFEGDFGVESGKLTDATAEADLTRLSESAEKDKKANQEDPQSVLSDVKGHVSAINGTATLSKSSFSVPGARAEMHGTYRLTDSKFDLHGTLLTTGSPSEATTGFKSFLVKAITPFLKKKASERIVPFKIIGSHGNAMVGLDLGTTKK